MNRLQEHPCFSDSALCTAGRIHLPVAPRCNIQCAFCDRRCDCANESRPGVTSAVLTPAQAVARAKQALAREPRLRVAGIAGPGDALANPETFETLRLLRRELPELILCLSSNGLFVERSIEALAAVQLEAMTITINASTVQTAMQVYTAVFPDGTALPPEEGCAQLLAQQRTALALCAEARIAVKLNTVLIPGVNDHEVADIARLGQRFGVQRMNVMPLIPCGTMADRAAPSGTQLLTARRAAAPFLPQFTHCRQCRADACGLL